MSSLNKAQDPAAAALLAIEEALNLRAAGENAKPAEASPGAGNANRLSERVPGERESAASGLGASWNRRDSRGTLEPKPTAIDEERLLGQALGGESEGAPSPELPAGAMQPVPAANDDRRSAGEILRAFRGRYDGIPAGLVAACTGLWIVFTLAYAFFNRAILFDLPAGALFPHVILYFMVIAGPVILLVLTASLLRRGQEMRIAARSMTDVAVRLAEPETIATEQLVTLSQAIRREVASMGDGIERALARASELETLVRSEVSNLERSYSDNERRIRALVDELATERESILTNADRVRGAIALAQENVSRDLSGASARFAESVGEAAGRVTASLNSKGEDIKAALIQGRDELVGQLTTHGSDLVRRLVDSGQQATASLTGASDGIARTLAERTTDLDGRLKTAREALAADLEIRGDALAQRLDAAGAQIADIVSSRGDTLAARVSESCDRLHEVVAVQGIGLSDNLAAMGERIGGLIAGRTAEARKAFEQSAEVLGTLINENQARLHARFEQHGTELHKRFAETADATAARLAGHTEALHKQVSASVAETLAALANDTQRMHSQLASTARDTVETLTQHTAALNEHLDATSYATLTALTTRTGQLQERLAATSAETLGALSAHWDEMSEKLEMTAQRSVSALTSSTDVPSVRFGITCAATLAQVLLAGS
ncbi:MAG: apolipoprotein A1/A4/E family protein, partial [Beijerinckiaceae bacterium]|nr:apolipoprotein A1/A4/E family protein [Beijerinckiaceae bacterium]